MKKESRCFGVGIYDVNDPIQLEDRSGGKRKVLWRCPYYQTWMSILRRCYSSKQQVRTPTYVGCTVDPRWHYFSNFKNWVTSQPLHGCWYKDNQTFQIDKDFLIDGNKIYGPETCMILPNYVNSLFTSLKKDNGEYPLGVFYKKANKKFQSQIYSGGKKLYLGLYEDPMEGHLAWQKHKIKDLEAIVARYGVMTGSDKRVLSKLIGIIEKIKQDVFLGVETKF